MKENTLYRHIRVVDYDKLFDSYAISNEPTCIHEIPQKKVGTICVIQTEKEIRVGISVCSRQDNFSRKIGSEVAYKRAIEIPQMVIPVELTNTTTEEELFKYCVKLLNSVERNVSSNIKSFQKTMKI